MCRGLTRLTQFRCLCRRHNAIALLPSRTLTIWFWLISGFTAWHRRIYCPICRPTLHPRMGFTVMHLICMFPHSAQRTINLLLYFCNSISRRILMLDTLLDLVGFVWFNIGG